MSKFVPLKKTTENTWKYTEDGDHYLYKTVSKFRFLGICFYSSITINETT
ncbi:hypothetical protein [Polaribacter sp. M15]